MRIFEAHRSVCSTVAYSPILAVQLAERALTACNYCQNHPLTLFVNVIGSASAGATQYGMFVSQFLPFPRGSLYCPERYRANFLPALHHWCNTPLSGTLIALRRYSCLQAASIPSTSLKWSVCGIPRTTLGRRPRHHSRHPRHPLGRRPRHQSRHRLQGCHPRQHPRRMFLWWLIALRHSGRPHRCLMWRRA